MAGGLAEWGCDVGVVFFSGERPTEEIWSGLVAGEMCRGDGPKTRARPRASGVRRGSGATAKPATTRPATARKATPRTGSTLDQDLAQHAAETYTEADLEAGKKLAVSIVSKTVTSGGLASLLSVLMPGAGAAAGAGGLTALLSKLSATYGDLSAQDQKHLRAVVAWVKGGFHLKLEPYTASGHELRLFP